MEGWAKGQEKREAASVVLASFQLSLSLDSLICSGVVSSALFITTSTRDLKIIFSFCYL